VNSLTTATFHDSNGSSSARSPEKLSLVPQQEKTAYSQLITPKELRPFTSGHIIAFLAPKMSQMSLHEIWEAAASSPFNPTIGKGGQFTVGFSLLVTGMF
jgi:hypothetical protein